MSIWAFAMTAGETDARVRSETARSWEVELEHLFENYEQCPYILLQTCHRIELYGSGLIPSHLEAPIRVEGEAAVSRLFRIAAGLESAVMGEDEVLHQVRQALTTARRRRAVDFRLGRLFESASAVGRRARAIPRTPTSDLAARAVEWILSKTSIKGRPFLVVGSGAVGRALARAARAEQAVVQVATRSPQGEELDLSTAAELAPRMAAIAVALKGSWTALLQGSLDLPPLADLSFPRAIPELVRERLEDNYLEIDQLFQQLPLDVLWMKRVEGLVQDGLSEYMDWLDGCFQVMREVINS